MKKYIMLYYTDQEKYKDLTDEELGKLIRAGINYGATGELPHFEDRFLNFAWTDLKVNIDISNQQYEKQVQSGAKGGLIKNFKEKLNLTTTQVNSVQKVCENKNIDFSNFVKEASQELKETGEVFEGDEGFKYIMDKISATA